MNILAIGLNHKTAPVKLRERLSFSSATLCAFLDRIDEPYLENARQSHSILSETVVLSTCNRMELYAVTNDPQQAVIELTARLSHIFDIPASEFSPYLYTLHHSDAIRHLMHVAAGLDSLVLGEAQILGQVSTALQSAQSHGTVGKILSRLFEIAIHAGKRARTETHIGVNPASVSSVAIHLAKKYLGDLSDKTMMVMGAGEMSTLTIQSAIQHGLKDILIVNRTLSNAESLAAQWDATPLTFDDLDTALNRTDFIIAATGAPHTILHASQISAAMKSRADKAMLIIDIALPRDVDEKVSAVKNAHLFNLDDLQHQVTDNLNARKAEIPKVTAIIEQEQRAFLDWCRSRDVVPTIAAFRRQIEAIRHHEVERALHRLPDLDDHQKAIVAELAHRLTNKFLHQPTVRLRTEAAKGNGVEYSHALNELFALDTE